MTYLVQLKLRREPAGHSVNQLSHITALDRETEKKWCYAVIQTAHLH